MGSVRTSPCGHGRAQSQSHCACVACPAVFPRLSFVCEIHGFKCVGAFVALPTAEGYAYQATALAEALANRLAFLDPLDSMADGAGERGTKHIQYNYLRRCANTICNRYPILVSADVELPSDSGAALKPFWTYLLTSSRRSEVSSGRSLRNAMQTRYERAEACHASSWEGGGRCFFQPGLE